MSENSGKIITVTLNPAVDKVLEVPGFQVGAHAKAQTRAVLPAGKGVNVARGLARLGVRALATGLIGRDEERMFGQSLGTEGVDARFCTVPGRTRTNTTVLDPEAHTTTHLREQGFEVGQDDLARLTESVTHLLAGGTGQTVVFSGSLPPRMRPADFAALVVACGRAGAQVVVDTNGPALRAALEIGAVDTLKPNLLELAECLGRSVSREHAVAGATELLGPAKRVLLTLGAEGAYLITSDLTVGQRCPLAESEVRNTVGCGDAFLAGWLRGEQVGGDESDALCWAVAAGAACAASETTVGYTLPDVQALLGCCEPLPPA
ncbi:MAG: 1-phosphofructokinase family hexose kinase [Planctomycetota bacterium]|jgi:1-phosphofructokinase